MNDQGKISIVIITYNRPADMLELAENIAALEHVELLKEVIVLNNQSTESYAGVEQFIKQHPQVPFKYFVAERNLGVSAGRNFAIEQASAPILVFLDDDALFKHKNSLELILQIFNEEVGTNTGVVAFKVLYSATMEMQQTAFPHKNFLQKQQEHRFLTYYFAGCAHAVRRKVFEDVGAYPVEFFYGMEEYDLSYRILDAGYTIAYDDRVEVLHKESPQGRLTNKEKLRGMWVNKSIVARKYLPQKFFYSTALLWSFEYLKKTGFDVIGWLKGWKQVSSISRRHEKRTVKDRTLNYLKQVRARLWY